ncbi:MAG: BrnT family toxin [Caldilineaceae bacterium]
MTTFEWDDEKNEANQRVHGIGFDVAQYAFFDAQRIIMHDEKHSQQEERWFCIGKVGEPVLTVRFTYRGGKIRIIGAGEWRKRRRYYERQNGVW